MFHFFLKFTSSIITSSSYIEIKRSFSFFS
nr:MAG TPA_asm: hypothetical protein [Bacteriophage sp.]DAP05615.1 MAG TPA: hypothetical protein [Caudoviricetes sp.]